MKISSFSRIVWMVSFAIILTLTLNVFMILAQGTVEFVDSGQDLGVFNRNGVVLSDLDSDGDLDAFVVNSQDPDKVWLNDGAGVFGDSGQSLGSSQSANVGLGDLDGDGDLDAFVVNSGLNKIWINGDTIPEFPPIIIIPLFMTATLLAIIFQRKHTSQAKQ